MAARSSSVVDTLAKALHHAPDGALSVPPAAVAAMQKQALALETGRELYETIGGLMRFASFLADQKKSPKAGQALVMALKPLVEKLEALAMQDARAIKAGESKASLEKKSLSKSAGAAGALGPQPKRGVRVGSKTTKNK